MAKGRYTLRRDVLEAQNGSADVKLDRKTRDYRATIDSNRVSVLTYSRKSASSNRLPTCTDDFGISPNFPGNIL